MATKKKASTKKAVKKKPVTKRKPVKKPAKPVSKRASKPVSKKKAALKRSPPMHASVTHPELSDDDETERDEVFEVFKSFDRDGSGSIDRGELARLLEALGQEIPEVELAIALDVIDVNHSGKISWDEFKAWWSAR